MSLSLGACAFLPGFGLLEDPGLYYLDVSEVAAQVACEVQSFMKDHDKDIVYRTLPWVLANEDISVKLTLQTDTSGYVNFTGVNASGLGLSALQNLITSTTSGKTSV